MYIEKVLDLWVQLMKNGGKNKSVAFVILFSVYMHTFLFKFQIFIVIDNMYNEIKVSSNQCTIHNLCVCMCNDVRNSETETK